MKATTRLFIVLFLCLIGCGEPEDSGSNDTIKLDPANPWFHFLSVDGESNQVPFDKNISCEIDDYSHSPNADPFACVETACQRVNGLWDDSKKSCQCSEGLYFSSYWGGSCIAPSPIKEEAKATTKPQISLYLYDQNQSPVDMLSADFDFSKYNAIPTAHSPRLNSSIVLRDEVSFSFPGAAVEESRWLNNIDHEAVSVFDSFLNGMRRPKPHFLIHSMQDFAVWTQSENPELTKLPVPQKSNLLFMAAQKIHETWIEQRYAQNTAEFDNVEYYSNSGCAGVCRLERTIHHPDTNYVGKEIRWYSGGQIYFWQIHLKVKNSSKTSQMVLHLDPSGQVNLIYWLDHQVNSEGYPTTGIHIYDSQWKQVQPTIVKNALPYSLNVRVSESTEVLKVDAASVLVCELGFEPLSKSPGRYRTGPFTSHDPNRGGSIWGWFENQEKDWSLFFSGLLETGYSGYSFEGREGIEHASEVADVILESSPLTSVTAISVADCYNRYDEWSKIVKAEGDLKVVNVSWTDVLEKRACQEGSPIGTTIKKSKDDFLWVLSASNSRGFLDSSDPLNFYCPRNLGALSNTLVVAYVDPQNPKKIKKWSGSNYGKNYADIAASGDSLNGKIGTSYSAPRVSAAAAEISALYPKMTIAELRMALLLGVDFHKMEVRSGGSLNLNRSKKLANIMFHLKQYGIMYTPDLLLEILYQKTIDEVTNNNRPPHANHNRKVKQLKLKLVQHKQWVKKYLFKEKTNEL